MGIDFAQFSRDKQCVVSFVRDSEVGCELSLMLAEQGEL